MILLWHFPLGTLCKGVIFDFLVSTGWSVSLPVILDAEVRSPLSQVLNPDHFFIAHYWSCWQEWWIPQKTRWFAFHVFVLVGKCLCWKCCSCIECSLTFCFFLSLQPCTEVLFLDIFHNYSQTLTPVLLEMVQNLQGWFYLLCWRILHQLHLGLENCSEIMNQVDSFSTLIVIRHNCLLKYKHINKTMPVLFICFNDLIAFIWFDVQDNWFT